MMATRTDSDPDSPLLLPRPRELERHGGWAAIPSEVSPAEGQPAADPASAVARLRTSGWLTVTMHPEFSAEAYTLQITAAGVQICARNETGVRHANATLSQLMRQYGVRLPTLTIRDQPVFAVRGVMLDVSRNRIPTMAEFTRIIPQLAEWKFNHLQLYVEHTIAYVGHDEAWRNHDPLTPSELRQLDDLCAEHGIELAANQNCFGHLSGFLSLPRYQHLAEIAPGGTWDFNGLVTRTGPFSLCPEDPAALAFVADLLGQLAPLIRSPWLNIGCDETFDVGQGRSRAAVASRGRAAVYLDFVRQVCALATGHGKRPQFWADIALEHPECLRELPRELCGLAWGYEGDARFAEWCAALVSAGNAAWVCPGTSSWRSLTGRTTDRRDNLWAAAEQGPAHGASGFLVTDWGDIGHRQQWPISLHGLAEAAHRAWSGTAPYDARAAGMHAFGNPEVGPWLDALGDADRAVRLICGKFGADGNRLPLRNATALFTDLHLELTSPAIASVDHWQDVVHRLASLQTTRPRTSSSLLDRELAHAVAMARLAAERAIARDARDRAGFKTLAGTYRDLLAEHRDLWLARSRFGGLHLSTSHDLRLITELENACV